MREDKGKRTRKNRESYRKKNGKRKSKERTKGEIEKGEVHCQAGGRKLEGREKR